MFDYKLEVINGKVNAKFSLKDAASEIDLTEVPIQLFNIFSHLSDTLLGFVEKLMHSMERKMEVNNSSFRPGIKGSILIHLLVRLLGDINLSNLEVPASGVDLVIAMNDHFINSIDDQGNGNITLKPVPEEEIGELLSQVATHSKHSGSRAEMDEQINSIVEQLAIQMTPTDN